MFLNLHITILVILLSQISNGEIVKTTGGLLNGTLMVSKNGREFLAYQGIPYAAPPIGNLRFKAPISPLSWHGIRNSSPPPSCIQPDTMFSLNITVKGQEDCLYLNVFTPQRKYRDNMKLPVMVFIYGGGFKTGNANNYNPKYFMDKNVVLVTFNYRVGPLGFFSLGSDPIPGNYGLKDQSFALKWIQNNIHVFGGDPKKVTLFGGSAGAVSINLHMFSPLSKGLFHQAIMQSGNAFSPVAFFRENMTNVFSHAFLFASGCYFDNVDSVLSCLRELRPETFAELTNRLHVWNFEPIVSFRATIENSNKINKKGWFSKIKDKFEEFRPKEKEPPFLLAQPSSETYISRVPCLVGQNSGEGVFIAARILSHGTKNVEWLNKNYKNLLPSLLEYIYVTNEPEKFVQAIEVIKNYYFVDADIGPNTDQKLVDLFTDAIFSYPTARYIQSSNVSQQFVYLYDHKSVFRFQTHVSDYEKDLGVSHGDEMHNFFYSTDSDRKRSSDDANVSKRLLDYWVNFATYGDPNGKNEEKLWKPTTTKNMEYLHIKTEKDEMKDTFYREKYNFWRKLPLGI